MIVTRGASILRVNVTGTVTNRTIQALVPGSARDIAFKAIIMWHGNRLSNKLNRHHTRADILSVLEVAAYLDL